MDFHRARAERRLAAILAADIVGYSRLIGLDEEGTRARLNAVLSDVVKPALARCRGRLFKTTGDGFFAEFASVVDAVDCAVEIQTAMNRETAGATAPLRFRMGVNLGDILVEGDDIHGDGVNVAARIEALANPGGLFISRSARDQVRDKLKLEIEDQGDISVKNIARPVRVFRVVLEGEDCSGNPTAAGAEPATNPSWARSAMVGAVAVVVIALVLFFWAPWQPRVQAASLADMQLELPDNPSVAVLPFNVVSGGEDDRQFADAMAEDLTRSLARISGLFVIARSSTLKYVGEAANPATVAEELGVRHVVRASFRRVGQEVRLDAELVDAISGRIVWSDRFDRASSDFFALQDTLVARLAAQLSADLGRAQEQQRFTSNPEAFFLWARADDESWVNTKESYANARALATAALGLDPDFVRPKAVLAFVETQTGYFRVAADPQAALERGLDMARDAVAAQPDDWYPHAALAQAMLNLRDYEGAHVEFERAIEMEPSHTRLLTRSALPLIFMGRGAEAEVRLRVAIRLNPFHDWLPDQLLGQALYLQERYEEAALSLETAAQKNPRFVGNLWWRSAAYAQLGRVEEAQELVATLLGRMPGAQISKSFIQISDPDAMARFEAGLRSAGLPD